MEGSLSPDHAVFKEPGTEAIVRFDLALDAWSGVGSGVHLGDGYFLTVLHNFSLDGKPIPEKLQQITISTPGEKLRSTIQPSQYSLVAVPGPVELQEDIRGGSLWLPDVAIVKVNDEAEIKKWKKVPTASIDFRHPIDEKFFSAGYGKSVQRPGKVLQIGETNISESRFFPGTRYTLYAAKVEHTSAELMSGDSGGPVFYIGKDGRIRVVALNQSRVVFDGGEKVFNYTNLNHPFVRNWIATNELLNKKISAPVNDLADPFNASLLKILEPTARDDISAAMIKDIKGRFYANMFQYTDLHEAMAEIIEKHGVAAKLTPEGKKEFIDALARIKYSKINTPEGRDNVAELLEAVYKKHGNLKGAQALLPKNCAIIYSQLKAASDD